MNVRPMCKQVDRVVAKICKLVLFTAYVALVALCVTRAYFFRVGLRMARQAAFLDRVAESAGPSERGLEGGR